MTAAMTWLHLLGLAVVIALIAAVTGMKPKGSRPVARTRLMSAARVVLVVMAVAIAALAIASRG